MVLFKKPIDGDIVISINKTEVITLGVFIGKFLIETKNKSFYKYNLSSKKNKDFYLYGCSMDKITFISKGKYVHFDPLKIIYDSFTIRGSMQEGTEFPRA